MARLSGKSKITKSEISQEINLKRLLGREPLEEDKVLFADLAVELINQRTLSGKALSGANFRKYSKSYADIKGVTRDNVDLFLGGNMLDSIKRQQSDESKNTVKISIEKGIETLKGFNHQTGDTLPKRQFFGITSKEAKDLAQRLPQQSTDNQTRFSFSDLVAAAGAVSSLETGVSNGEG